MSQSAPNLTRPSSAICPFAHGRAGDSSTASAASTWRWVLLYSAVIAAFVGCGLLQPPPASAEPLVRNPTTIPAAPTQTSGATSTATSTVPGLTAPASQQAAYNCTWIANGAAKPPWGVWLRKAPSTKSSTVGLIPNGTIFGATCNPINGFVSTIYKGTFGYANTAYLIQIVE
jgi:hypothetical protein